MGSEGVLTRLHTLAQLRQWRASHGEQVGFVPTMGNLHEGHLQLVREALAHCDHVIVSIFVNPLQFGPNEDFDRYPRTLDADCGALATLSHDIVVYAPDVADMYPQGHQSNTRVTVSGISEVLCGASRPGHFDGVATVVCKLLQRVQPAMVYFGRKDFQQLAVIRQMVGDLDIPVTINAVDTVREADGLALSSRNQYLTREQRQSAPALYQVLQKIAHLVQQNGVDQVALKPFVADLQQKGFGVDYLEIRDAATLAPATPRSAEILVAVAAFLGKTRLIDNVVVI